ncbi:hypothetical protein A2707_01590 [Candidatus Saccharibacteria bacterium RIFCSPHIGHO2_01_FULL_45_15]|nr:MAG: hypothetical protein A2707_01590 [Candidatus Saccharibacteria bacterium RIFCSPHIGHO2_01_FULL_45_15]OGL27972.1 MAG: hypothetical protein A3C39_02685 [Candidatus Saccharibacteria bacterium RIFCSPHIGHO2_02_FULL_46_12]OGL31721.1 MAG: hypothetical protein A3E76_01250 [Candidatus Saccharibacteria bacterium RIFCSPHIGHO2_12_FULL_44_22]
MNEKLTITRQNIQDLQPVARGMADAYMTAFAGPPWYEVTRCIEQQCPQTYSSNAIGDDCESCGQVLVMPAYDQSQLQEGWRSIVANEDAMIEVDLSRTGVPLRATIARPTDATELYTRKYSDVPQMQSWINQTLPTGEFVWIEDTFANLAISPRGNLNGRGRTLGAIAMRYGAMQIATRTKSPAIIRATGRDAGDRTNLYIGTESFDASVLSRISIVSAVPDARSVLVVAPQKDQ